MPAGRQVRRRGNRRGRAHLLFQDVQRGSGSWAAGLPAPILASPPRGTRTDFSHTGHGMFLPAKLFGAQNRVVQWVHSQVIAIADSHGSSG